MSQNDAARMPPGIPFIVVNEFAERFCYYGINAILSVYMTQFLRFGDAQATVWQSMFKSGAYFFPLIGAIVSDVFWGKFRTIMTFSLAYTLGCALLALGGGTSTLAAGLFLIAFGTGGIKPCVSTNVGDQFTARNAHLIERAFSYFYLAINAGSMFSIYLCPIFLEQSGPRLAFGVPGLMMLVASLTFWLGRKRFAVVPPAGRAWLDEVFSPRGLKTMLGLLAIYVFIGVFWSLWEQSNGQTWTLQAESSLMDKSLGFGITLLPAQVQIANAVFVLILSPLFSLVVYPLVGRVVTVTPLRKIGAGLFTTAASFLIIARIEGDLMAGQTVSVWWQILAYFVLTCGEVMVYITGLEFSYKQAPLRVKSFIMALFLLANSMGNLVTAAVNEWMVRPLPVASIQPGPQTIVRLQGQPNLVVGQKIDFAGNNGVQVMDANGAPQQALQGTYLVASIDVDHQELELMDPIDRKPVVSSGQYTGEGHISTYALVGPAYFLFFAALLALVSVIYIFVAMVYRETSYVREDDEPVSAAVG